MTIASVQEIRPAIASGVGSENRWVQAEPDAPDRLTQAELDLHRWKALRHSAGVRWPACFPYESVLGYLRSAGRNRAEPRLIRELRKAHLALTTERAGRRSTADADLLTSWLPMTFDAGDGTYDSYIGAPILEALPERLEGSYSTGEVIDTVAAAVLADLVLVEAEALEADPTGKRQAARLRAAVQALRGAVLFAPDSVVVGAEDGTEVPTTAAELIDTSFELAGGVLDASPDLLRRSVSYTLLPTTTRHDELMFIRGIQAFECVYQQVARSAEIAIDEIRGGDPVAAAAELDRATARLAATPILYRLVTTMPKESFAVIRDATDGRSAIQSRPYNRVEQLCARSDLDGVHCRPADQTGGRPTLEEVLAERGAGLDEAVAVPLAASMQRLDEAWRSMKRTHWGVALKIIGRVPGTGGTAGADYLQEKSQQHLFPNLTSVATP